MNLVLRIKSSILCIVLLCSLVLSTTDSSTDSTFTRRQDVIYGYKFGMALTMDVFSPETPNGKGVIWVISSSGRSSRDKIKVKRFTELLKNGYTLFAVLHSSEPRFNLQDMVSDVRLAVRYIRYHAKEYQIDGERLGIMGSSAGGYLSLMVGLNCDTGSSDSDDPVQQTSNKVKAVACFFSPTDWSNFGENGVNVIDFQTERYGRTGSAFAFYEHDKNKDTYTPINDREKIMALLKTLSPVTHVSHDDPATLIIHGDADRFVPFQQGESLHQKLKEEGVVTKLIRREGKDHGWEGWTDDMKWVVEWFDRHL